MLSIGDFARLGRVSVRMLRHYDAIGLLNPARVDASSGYRYYTADQLARLNRLVALKDLGFTLEQVRVFLDDRVDIGEMRGMLRLRQAELEEQVTADLARLARVGARLRLIEREGHMTTHDVVIKSIPTVRVAELSAVAASYASEDIGPVIQPLYPRLCELMEKAGMPIAGPGVAYYEDLAGDGVRVHAGFQVDAAVKATGDIDVVQLPAVAQAASLIHHGAMDHVDETYTALARWIDENGFKADGAAYAREVYLDCPPEDKSKWVTELQMVVTRV